MKLKLDIDPDIAAMMQAEVLAGERAVTAAMRQADSNLKADWRGQITGAGLGQRLARSIRNKTYPERGESLDAAAFIWSKAPKIIRAHDKGTGRRAEVLSQTLIGAELNITLLEEPVRTVEVGNTFDIFAGCDKRFETCQAKFANAVNFRGFPHIPGQDTIIRYAAKGDANAGSVL